MLTYVQVPLGLRGQGIGSILVQRVLDHAREQGIKVVPICPFIRDYILQHPEYKSVLAGK